MKKFWGLCLLLSVALLHAQEADVPKKYTLDASPFYGTILLHSPDIAHLITDHPGGFIVGLNRKHFGHEEWEAAFGYPDTGFSFIYQGFNNPILGENFGVYAHFNFYFLKRFVQLRIGQGIAYATNPYDAETNFRNNAFGSTLLSSTYAMLNFQKENLYKGIGVKAGLSVVHYSNANVRAPNTSTNTLAANVGLTYDLDGGKTYDFIPATPRERFREPIRFNLAFSSGINESDEIGSGQFPFYIFTAYADKRLGKRSAIQLGTEAIFSNFLDKLIRFQSTSFPELNVDPNTSSSRVGVFVGHELFINRISVLTQLGYYAFYPFDFAGRVYNRVGLKYYFKDKLFGSVALRSHGASAEAVEFGIGIRL